MTDITIIKAVAKKLSDQPVSRSFYVDVEAATKFAARQDLQVARQRFNQYESQDWANSGAEFLNYEGTEEQDWAADQDAHWFLSLFVAFAVREWAEEETLEIIRGLSNGNGLKTFIENVTCSFVEAWTDAREGR